jgi:hypothetical protein
MLKKGLPILAIVQHFNAGAENRRMNSAINLVD